MSFDPKHQHPMSDTASFEILRITPSLEVVESFAAQAGCRVEIQDAYSRASARVRELNAPPQREMWFIVTPTWLDGCRYADRYKEDAMRG